MSSSWNRAGLQAQANSRLSNSMEVSDISVDDSLTGRIWGGVFFHPRFTVGAKKCLNLTGETVFLRHKGSPVCALNLLRHRRPFIRSATIPLLFQYYGVISITRDFPAELPSELNSFIKNECDIAIFSFPPDFPVEILSAINMRTREYITLALNEDDLRVWGQNFRDDVKNKIRKAERESVEIGGIDVLPEKLWEQAYTRKNLKPPIAASRLREWCASLIAGSLLKIYIASKDGHPVAFRGELIFGDYAYDWIAGSDPQYHNTGANQLLMAEIGSSIVKSGIKKWDLVGGQIRTIYDFKKSFGAREYTYYQGIICFNVRGKLYSILHKIRHGD